MIQRWGSFNGLGVMTSSWTVGSADSEPRGKALASVDYDIEALLIALGIRTADPAKKRSLKELDKALSKILNIVNQIPSSGIRNMLMELFAKIVDLAKNGMLDAALDMAKDVGKLADDCLNACRHINTNITTLKNPVGVQGPAKAVLQQIAQCAKAAMAGASSLKELQDIGSMTDKAVEIAGELRGVEPGTKEYRRLLSDLVTILENLAAMVKPGESDILLAALNESTGVRRNIDELRKGVSDPVKLEKLANLEDRLTRAIDAAGPQAGEAGFRRELNALMATAAAGKLDEAIAGAGELAERTERLGKLHRHLDKKMERLEGLLERLEGPARERLEAVLDKARRAGGAAQTPEQLIALDAMLMKALEGADALAADRGSTVRSPGYLKLLAAERELDACLPPGEPASSGLGRDQYAGPGAAAPAGPGNGAPPPGGSSGLAEPPDFGSAGLVEPPDFGSAGLAEPPDFRSTGPVAAPNLLPGASEATTTAARRDTTRHIAALRTLAEQAGGDAARAIAGCADRAAGLLAAASDPIDVAHANMMVQEAAKAAKALAEASPGSDAAQQLQAQVVSAL